MTRFSNHARLTRHLERRGLVRFNDSVVYKYNSTVILLSPDRSKEDTSRSLCPMSFDTDAGSGVASPFLKRWSGLIADVDIIVE